MRRAARQRKVVIDTNLVVSGLLLRRGSPHELIVALRQDAFRLVITPALREEYERVLRRPRFAEKYGLTSEEIADFLAFVAQHAVNVRPRRRLPVVVRDQHDENVLAAALGKRAQYLVTGDDDLLVLRDDPKLRDLAILTGREFLEILRSTSDR
jgi:putative PIN family toxin of toxin-antitoxin system